MNLLESIVSALTEIENIDLEKMKLFSTPKYNNMMFGYLQKAAQMNALDKPTAIKIFTSIQDKLEKARYEKGGTAQKQYMPKIRNIQSMKTKQIVDMSQQYFDKLFQLDRYGASKVKQQVVPVVAKLPDEVSQDQIVAPDMPKKSWEDYLAKQAGADPERMRIAKKKDAERAKQAAASPTKSNDPEMKKKLAAHPGLPAATKTSKPSGAPKPPPVPMQVTPDMMMPPDLPKKPSLQKEPPPTPADRNAPGQEMKKALSNLEKGKKSGIKKKRTYKVTDKDIMGPAESVIREKLDKMLSEMIFKFFQEEIL